MAGSFMAIGLHFQQLSCDHGAALHGQVFEPSEIAAEAVMVMSCSAPYAQA